jgi:thiamine pyrophosphokinase
MIKTAVVVAGGAPGPMSISCDLGEGALVVAADGGVDRALALGLHVDVAIGDFDSVTKAGLAAAERAGARAERHPAAKDATDLELALDTALAAAPARILVVGSESGRLDHLFSSLLLIADPRYAAAEVDALLGGAQLHVIRGARTLAGVPGELVSLLAVHGPAEGVSTSGLVYPLVGETLPPGTSRGVSNVFAAAEARISVAHGILLAIRPGGLA